MGKIAWMREWTIRGTQFKGQADGFSYTAFDPGEKSLHQEEHDARIEKIALANGYVKAADYEALKLKLAEVTDQLKDATDTLDQIESESHLFHATAIASGYIKLEPGQVVVDERNYTLAMRMAAKWAEHVAGNDRWVTVTKMEARDE